MWRHLLLLLPLWFSCCLYGFYNWSDIVEIIPSTRAPYLFFLPTTLVSYFSDKWCGAEHYLPVMQTLILPRLPRHSHSHHPRSSDLLSSLVCVIKRRVRCSPQIKWSCSANTSTSNNTEDFTTKQKVLIETLQPLPQSSSPSAPLEICDWLKGTFFLSSAGSLPSRCSCLQSLYSRVRLHGLHKVKRHWTCGGLSSNSCLHIFI